MLEQGIAEHLDRAGWLRDLASTATEPKARFRFHILAIYSLRAVVEHLLDAAQDGQLKRFSDPDPASRRAECAKSLRSLLPHYDLVERIRIHDFHRWGLTPRPNAAAVHSVTLLGPMRLTVPPKSSAMVQLNPSTGGLEATGRGEVKLKRELVLIDELFVDPSDGARVSAVEIISATLEVLPNVARDLLSGAVR